VQVPPPFKVLPVQVSQLIPTGVLFHGPKTGACLGDGKGVGGGEGDGYCMCLCDIVDYTRGPRRPFLSLGK